MRIYVIMGVAGCGKSTVGREASSRLKLPFLEGDDFHSPANVAKMASGAPLTNEDRMPWVDEMTAACNAKQLQTGSPIILACSALTKSVRERLQTGLKSECHFVHLQGDIKLLTERLSKRKGHFFKPDLLASQYEALDIPISATCLDVALSVDDLVGQLCGLIQSEDNA